jgi:hypothetical protein
MIRTIANKVRRTFVPDNIADWAPPARTGKRQAISLTFGAAVLLSLVLIGCGSVFTTTSEPAGNGPVSALGSYYFLPKTRIKIDGAPKDTTNYVITIAQVNEPDRNHRYFLRYHRNVLSEDAYTVTVDSKGLLQTLNLTAEDKTPAIINKIADTIVSAISAAESGAGLRGARGAKGVVVEAPFSVTFDPQDEEEYSAAERLIDKAGFTLTITPKPNSSGTASARTSSNDKGLILNARSASEAELQKHSSDGVFFHPPTTVTIKITPQSGTRLLVQKTELRIPDKNQLAVFDLRRMALVKRTTNLVFSEGNLTTVTETRPSQVLAAVSIPADLAAKAATAIPSIIKIQNENANASTNAETARINAQTALINAETSRLKAEDALNQLRAAHSGTTPPPQRSATTRSEEKVAQSAEATPTPTPSP